MTSNSYTSEATYQALENQIARLANRAEEILEACRQVKRRVIDRLNDNIIQTALDPRYSGSQEGERTRQEVLRYKQAIVQEIRNSLSEQRKTGEKK